MTDPKIRYDIEADVTGQNGVQSMENALQSLGETLEGDLKKQAQEAATALNALGTKQAAIVTFQQLETTTASLANELNTATQRVDRLAAELPVAAAATKAFATAEEQARTAVSSTQAILNEQRAALVALRAQFTGTARGSDEYKQANEQLQVTIKSLRGDVAAQQADLKATVSTSADAALAQRNLEKAFSEAGAESARITKNLGAQRTALDAAKTGMQALGIETSDLAQYQRNLAAQSEQVQNSVRALAPAFSSAAASQAAFATLGVKSADSIRAAIARVNEALDVVRTRSGLTGAALETALGAGQAKLKSLQAELRQTTGEFTLAERASKLLGTSFGAITGGNLAANAIATIGGKVADMGRAFVAANVQAETMRRGLTAVYGSAKTAGDQIDFLRSTARASGIAVGDISEAFVRFSAATKSSNIPLATTNELFAAVTRAGSTLGLTGERVTLVLDALGQMASKGVVSMEELRQQLGDSLPGALSRAATGLGITDAQLIKLVESGKLATEDFFPALTKGLADLAGDSNTLASSFGNFKTALNAVYTTAGDAGGLDVLKGAMSALMVVVGAVAVPFTAFLEVLFGVGKAAGILAASIVTLTNPLDALSGVVEDAAARQQKVRDAFFATSEAAKQQSIELKQTAAATAGHASAVLGLVVEQQKAEKQAGATGNAYIKQLVALQQNSAAVEAAIAASQLLLGAKEAEGKAQVLTAQLTGSASKALDAQSAAATANVAASRAVIESRQLEVNNTRASIAATQAAITAGNDLSGQKARALLDLQKTLQVQDAELAKSKETTFELDRQALSAQAAATAYADNTDNLGLYQSGMEAAGVQVAILTDLYAQQQTALAQLQIDVGNNIATTEQYERAQANLAETKQALDAATGNAAKNERLYRDAVADSVAAVDRKARAAAADVNITLAQVKAQQSHFDVLARAAQAQGNTTLALEYSIDAKYKEIEATKLATQIKNLELEADRQEVQIKLDSLQPGDALYQQQKAELELRLKIIKAKQIQANASDEIVRGIQAEIDAMRSLGSLPPPGQRNGGGGNGGGNGNGGGGGGGSDRRYTGSTNFSNGRPDSQNNPDNFVGADGLERRKSDGAAVGSFTNTLPIDKAFAVRQNGSNAYGAGDVQYLQEAKQQALNAGAQFAAMMKVSAGSVGLEAQRDARGLLAATTAALDRAQRLAAGEERARSTTHNVKIEMSDGNTSDVGVKSEDDAKTLVDTLTKLQKRSTR